jgi:hypothetical protein
MTSLIQLCQWLYDLPGSTALRESDNAFPLVETVHVLSVSLMAGTIVVVDLRVAGWLLRTEPVTRVAGALLPWTWWGFALMVLSGLPLFASEAIKLYGNPAFRLKALLLVLAGLNALLFHGTTFRSVGDWDRRPVAPLRARLFAIASMTLWSGVIVSGRMIAVFHGH